MKWIQTKPKRKPNKHDSITTQCLKIRGIPEEDEDRFLNPKKDELHDPYSLMNIVEASEKIVNAIKNNSKVVISFDNDADGLTSGAIIYRYLNRYLDESNLEYIYSQRGDGHGIKEQIDLSFMEKKEIDEDDVARFDLNKENVRKIEESDLLIIVDSSSNDSNACKEISEWGTEVIILDHHSIENENPYALIVNPQQNGDKYPNKSISGAGIVFKTIQVVEDFMGDEGHVNVFEYMDLVAVGLYADMMRMDVYENRYMVMHGLRNMKNVGLVRILKGGKADFYKLDGDSIGFIIAPLLNGVARLNEIELGIQILLTDDDDVAKKLRLKMQKLNEKRKEMQNSLATMYEKSVNTDEKILLVMDDESSKGFNGLIAQQLAQKFKRPVLVGRLHNKTYSGSFRSYGGFDLKTFLQDCHFVKESLGHNQAGGFVIPEENIVHLQKYIHFNMDALEEKDEFAFYDIELDVNEIDNSIIKEFERVNMVTGSGFRKIVARVNNITIEDVETLGKTKETRKVKTLDKVELIRFKVDESYAEELSVFDSIDCIGTISNNEFYNFKLKQKIVTPQIILFDYKQK